MLEIKKIKKIYRDKSGAETTACKFDNLFLSENCMIGLKGVSGSGKSTFLNMISGIILPTEGEIIFRGANICTMSESMRDEWRAHNIGYVFQAMNLIEQMTAIENVMLPAIFASRSSHSGIKARAFTLLESVGLVHKAYSKPDELSAGERQRIAVARALINEPALILADEPTASLDEENATNVIDILINRCKQSRCALIVASHDAKILSNFAEIVLMERV